MTFTKPFEKIGKGDAAIAGGKGASLGEMTRAGIPVPPGFVVLANAFDQFLKDTDIGVEIDAILDTVDIQKMHTVEHASEKIQNLIMTAKMPEGIAKEIVEAYETLRHREQSLRRGDPAQIAASSPKATPPRNDSIYVAVRSSATVEDSASAAWAGQLESFLNTIEDNLLLNVQKCWASLYTPRAIFYGFEKGYHTSKQKTENSEQGEQISVAVVVQTMIQSEVSGIAFSVHPVTQDRNQLIIEAGYGLGEAIVSGQITPDSYVVTKNPLAIIDKNISEQTRKLVRSDRTDGGGGNEWVSASVIPAPEPGSLQESRDAVVSSTKEVSKDSGSRSQAHLSGMTERKSTINQKLSDAQILELSHPIIKIENHYGFPCDIEWALESGQFYITQSRPITTLAKPVSIKDFTETVGSIRWSLNGIYRNSVLFNSAIFPYVGIDSMSFIGIKAGFSNVVQVNKESYVEEIASNSFVGLLLKKIQEDNSYLDYFIFESRKAFGLMESVSQGINGSLKFTESSEELGKLLSDFFQSVAGLVPWFWSVSYLGEALDEYIKSQVKMWSPDLKERQIDEFISKVSYNAENHAEDNEMDEVLTISELDEGAIERLYKKYAWLDLNIWEGQPFTLEDYALRIQKMYSEKDDLLVKKRRITELSDLSLSIIGQIDNASLSGVLRSMRELIFLKTEQMDIFARSWSNMLPLVSLVVRRLSLSVQEVMLCSCDEVINALNGISSIDSEELAARAEAVACLRLNDQMHYFSGQKVDLILAAIKKEISTNIIDLKGSAAFAGIVRGTVKVVLSSKDLGKINKGDILVSHATNSNYDLAFAQVVGVVTDEGGVLCHTAVLAREFQTPSVIGTKIATQVLRDGDLVEVDADNGVVRILERA